MNMPKTIEKGPFYSQGLNFTCKRCSSCCRFDSGYVFLSLKDVLVIEKTLDMKQTEFIQTYCRWIESVNNTYQLALKEKTNYDCIFWKDKIKKEQKPEDNLEGGCSVYEVRPLQCRAYPFWHSILCDKDTWKMAARDCPGMDRGDLYTRDSIEKWLALRQNEPIMSKGEF